MWIGPSPWHQRGFLHVSPMRNFRLAALLREARLFIGWRDTLC
jgi:hypothetical protein